MSTAIKHDSVPHRVKPSFVTLDSYVHPECQSALMSTVTNDCLTQSGTGCW